MSLVPDVPTQTPENDPVPADVRAVIDLFNAHLSKVAFPDVDSASLRRLADEVRGEAKNVLRARDALAAAEAVAEARLSTLKDAAARAVAYAQVYSEGHPDRAPVAAALAGIVQGSRPTMPPIKHGKRRGRPPKHTPELFDASADAAASAG